MKTPEGMLETAKSKRFAGIGSRLTPPPMLALMVEIGIFLARGGFTLRSGGSPGADTAFEEGCDRAGGRKEIFLPWKGFQGNASPLHDPAAEAYRLAAAVHPAWHACSPAGRKLHARNCHQILGGDLRTPVDFVLYWAREERGRIEGGTATGVALARSRGIACVNLGTPGASAAWRAFIPRSRAPGP